MEQSNGNSGRKGHGTSSSAKVRIGGDDAALRLVGSIVEKGVSGDGRREPPRPSVVPFPVARHRSHGPHWGPITARKVLDDIDSGDLDEDDEEDRRIGSSEKLAALACPVQRKEKRGLDFRNLQEVVSSEIPPGPPVGRKQSFEVKGSQAKKSKEQTKLSNEACLTIANSVEETAPQHWVSAKPSVDGGKDLGNRTKGGSVNIFNDVTEASLSLEREIDIENRARLESMSPDEIAEAQSEIREKLNPQLLEILRKRRHAKSNNQSRPELIASDGAKVINQTGNEDVVNTEASSNSRNCISLPPRKETVADNQYVRANGGRLWNAWSARVEAVRKLRFSLEGDVIGFVETEDKPGSNSQLSSDVTERDFLRTEGDPGALGYTIREAVALSRSVVPAQRALALHLLASVLAKAMNNVWCEHGEATHGRSIDENAIDWEAVWAFTLGPEPELALALRMCLDDNHNSVLLACSKLIQCVLSSELNEKFFNYWEMTDVHGRGTCTAPVFRSKKNIEECFLPGGFWKYSAKPSNMLSISKVSSEDNEKAPTIQDDLFVAGQDFAAGLVRMGILPRIGYLLETEASAVLEECLVSILIAISRHSPVAATAVVECPMLIETILSRFTMESNRDFDLCKIKYIILFKVLAGSNKKHCLEFVRSGKIQALTWHLYRSNISLDHWISSGKENLKISSKLMVEQLRLLRTCISYGQCVSYFKDIFPVICLWLSFPPMEKLVYHGIVTEFLSISAEAYLVLCALAGRLPSLHEQRNPCSQVAESAIDDLATWSWSFVSPIVDIAMKWIEMRGDPMISRFFELPVGETNTHEVQTLTSLLWVYAAIIQMLHTVFEKVGPCKMVTKDDDSNPVPWLPEFIPKIALEFIRNGFVGSFDTSSGEDGTLPRIASVLEALCNLRRHGQYEISLASVCSLRGIIQMMRVTDNLIELARVGIAGAKLNGEDRLVEEKILEGGMIKGSQVHLENMVNFFSDLVASEWTSIQSVEMFGRGGPAPGLGVGWGAPKGGYWSLEVLLAQKDANVLVTLLGTLPSEHILDVAPCQHKTIHSAIFACSTVLPGGSAVVGKSVDFVLQVPVLSYFCSAIQHFLSINSRSNSVCLEFLEGELHHFSEILSTHYRSRWLNVKKKVKALVGNNGSMTKQQKKKRVTLDTIDEDAITSEEPGIAQFTELIVQWTFQRLPLPIHWFLSPLTTMLEPPEVVKAGLFFFLGLEAISCGQVTASHSPVELVPLVWKMHLLSATLLVGMAVLEEQRIRVIYEVLQDYFGRILDKTRSEPETGKKNNYSELLRFQSEIHESYSTFIEAVVDQFAADSYGDALYGRQVAIYLHRDVEVSVRLVSWNILSNARVLELLPPLHECIGSADGYLEPPESDEHMLEAYVKSWVSGALDRAAPRKSVAFTLFIHHISSFTFSSNMDNRTPFRNRLVKSMLRHCSVKRQCEGVMLDVIRYDGRSASRMPGKDEALLRVCDVSRRLQVLRDASEGNSSLLATVDRLTSALA